MLRHDWRRLGISAEKVREFCVWRNAPDLVDSYDPPPWATKLELGPAWNRGLFF